MKDFDRFKGKEWEKNYSGRWSILSFSYFAFTHTFKIKEVLGTKLDTNIITSHKGVCACYCDHKEFDVFGKSLVKQVNKNPDIVVG